MSTWLPILSVLIAPLATMGVAFLTIRSEREKHASALTFQRQKFDDELKAQLARLEAEFATQTSVETALRHLLEIPELRYRSFPRIQHHIGGFESNELRRSLVRAGAVRFIAEDGTEMWALRERVPEQFRLSAWRVAGSPKNKVPKSNLFPGAFNDASQF